MAKTQEKTSRIALRAKPGAPLLVLSLLLAGALLWAYLITHSAVGEPSAGTVQVWGGEARQLRKLNLRNDEIRVTLVPEWGERDDPPYVWIETEKKRQPRPARNKKARPQPKQKPSLRAFRGNSKAVALIGNFAVLRAARAVGAVDSLDQAAFGLDKPKGSVRVELEGEENPFELALGSMTYGKKMRYALFREDETVYLFRQSLFNNLIRANSALIDRTLFPFPAGLATRLEVVREGETVIFHKRAGAAPGEPAWGDAPDDPEGDPALGNLIAALERLKVLEYLAEEKPPAEDAAIPLLEVRLFQEGPDVQRRNAWLKLFSAEKRGIIALGSHTRKRVRLSARKGKGVIQSAAEILRKRMDGEKTAGQKG